MIQMNHKSSKPIIYLDANNLYGWGMTTYIPTGGFKWLTQAEIKKFDVNTFKKVIEMVVY